MVFFWFRIWLIIWWIVDKWLFWLKRSIVVVIDNFKEVDFFMIFFKRLCNIGYFVLSLWINGSMLILYKFLLVELWRKDVLFSLFIVFDFLVVWLFIKRCIFFFNVFILIIFLVRVLFLLFFKIDFKIFFYCFFIILDLIIFCNLFR